MNLLWILFLLMGVAAGFNFDCSEEESKYYLEQKLQRYRHKIFICCNVLVFVTGI
jgi:hypothetical protein